MTLEISREELKEEIESSINVIKQTKSRWGRIIPKRIPSAYYRLGLYSRGIAVYNLLLGNKKEALEWFRKSAKYFIKSVEQGRDKYKKWEGEAGSCSDAFYMSILSRDRELLKKAMELTFDIHPDYPNRFPDPAGGYYCLMALSKKLVGDVESAKHFIEKAKTARKHKGFEDFENGQILFIEGIIREDEKLCLQGAKKLSEYHSKKPQSMADDKLVNIRLTALLLIAKRRNIDLKLDNEYIPKTLLEDD